MGRLDKKKDGNNEVNYNVDMLSLVDKEEGEVCLPVKDFVQLVTEAADKNEELPVDFIVDNIHYVGRAENDFASLKIALSIIVLSDDYTTIKLLSSQMALKHSSIKVTDSEDDAVNPPDEQNDAERSEPFLTCIDDWYSLVTKGRCVVNVDIDAVVKYQTDAGKGVHFPVILAKQSDLLWTVPRADTDIKVVQTLGSSQEIGAAQTQLKCPLLPSNFLTVSWTDHVDEVHLGDEEEDNPKELVLNCTQFVRCSVGEGVLLCDNTVEYSVVSSSVDSFDFTLPAGVRVLNVEGSYLRRWDTAVNDPLQTVSIILTRAVEKAYTLKCSYELDLKKTSVTTSLPVLTPLNINRNMGFISLGASTNIEICEAKVADCARLGPEELPSQMKTASPVLFSYKFLQDVYLVSISIKKHSDVGVLTATCDSALFTVTAASDSLLYRLRLLVRNTSRQYLRLRTPPNADVWSAVVNGNLVKPVADESGLLMLPLSKSACFAVEIVYALNVSGFETNPGKGELAFTFPWTDISINHLFVSLFLPKEYVFGTFEGDLGENIRRYSVAPDPKLVKSQILPPNAPPGGSRNHLMVRRSSISKRNRRRYSSESDEYQDAAPVFSKQKRKQFGGLSGVVPVRVEIPCVGQEFKFEKLLVGERELAVSVSYRKVKPPLCPWLTFRRVVAVLSYAVVGFSLGFFPSYFF